MYIPTYVQCTLSYFRIAQHRYVAASLNDLDNIQQGNEQQDRYHKQNLLYKRYRATCIIKHSNYKAKG
jgi:hypothetical protein